MFFTKKFPKPEYFPTKRIISLSSRTCKFSSRTCKLSLQHIMGSSLNLRLCLSVCLVLYCPYCLPPMSGGQAGHREQDRQTNRALSSSRKPKYAAKKKKLLPRLISGVTFYSVKDLKVWHRNVCYNKWWNWNKKSNFSGNYLLNRKSDINNLKLAHFKRWSKYAILTFLLAKSKKKTRNLQQNFAKTRFFKFAPKCWSTVLFPKNLAFFSKNRFLLIKI